MHQILFDFGQLELFGLTIPLRIYGYGLMLVLGFVLSIGLAQWRAKRVGESPEVIAVVGIWSLIGGIFGARLAYVIENWDTQFANRENPLGSMLDITSGGLIYYGGLGLAMLLVVVYFLYKRVPLRRYLDIVTVSLMVGLAFGRMGCLLNGCCWGGHCSAESPIATEFPMYSQPLVKLDGRDNPYSQGLKGPSPPFAEKLDGLGRIDRHLLFELPPEKSGEFARSHLIPAGQLHPKLSGDQLVLLDRALTQTKELFSQAAGSDGLLSQDEWNKQLLDGNGLLAGSEIWAVAELHDFDRDQLLSSKEFDRYVQTRGAMLLWRFDGNGDHKLDEAERVRANDFLQADQIAIAQKIHTEPLLPAQLLGIINALLLAVLLGVFFRFRWREGQVFAMLLIMYPITRFLLELIRSDNPHNLARLQLTHNQWTSVITVVVGIAMMVWLQRCNPSAGPVLSERLAAAKASKPDTDTTSRRRKRR